MRLPTFIYLCVSKITQKCVHGLTFKPNLDYSPDNNNNNKQIYKAPCMPTAGCRGAERPEPDCFLRYHMRCNTQFYYIGKIPRSAIGRPSLQRGAVYSLQAVGTTLSEVHALH